MRHCKASMPTLSVAPSRTKSGLMGWLTPTSLPLAPLARRASDYRSQLRHNGQGETLDGMTCRCSRPPRVWVGRNNSDQGEADHGTGCGPDQSESQQQTLGLLQGIKAALHLVGGALHSHLERTPGLELLWRELQAMSQRRLARLFLGFNLNICFLFFSLPSLDWGTRQKMGKGWDDQ